MKIMERTKIMKFRCVSGNEQVELFFRIFATLSRKMRDGIHCIATAAPSI